MTLPSKLFKADSEVFGSAVAGVSGAYRWVNSNRFVTFESALSSVEGGGGFDFGEQLGDPGTIIFMGGASSGDTGWLMGQHDGTIGVGVYVRDGLLVLVVDSVEVGSIHRASATLNILITWGSSETVMYVNGEQSCTHTAAPNLPAQNFTFGANSAGQEPLPITVSAVGFYGIKISSGDLPNAESTWELPLPSAYTRGALLAALPQHADTGDDSSLRPGGYKFDASSNWSGNTFEATDAVSSNSFWRPDSSSSDPRGQWVQFVSESSELAVLGALRWNVTNTNANPVDVDIYYTIDGGSWQLLYEARGLVYSNGTSGTTSLAIPDDATHNVPAIGWRIVIVNTPTNSSYSDIGELEVDRYDFPEVAPFFGGFHVAFGRSGDAGLASYAPAGKPGQTGEPFNPVTWSPSKNPDAVSAEPWQGWNPALQDPWVTKNHQQIINLTIVDLRNGQFRMEDLSAGIKKDLKPSDEGVIEGTVTDEDGLPLSRLVRLLERGSGFVVREQWSDAQGHYEFRQLNKKQTFTVIAHDYTGVYNATCVDNAVPE